MFHYKPRESMGIYEHGTGKCAIFPYDLSEKNIARKKYL